MVLLLIGTNVNLIKLFLIQLDPNLLIEQNWMGNIFHLQTSSKLKLSSSVVWAWQTHPEGNLTAVMTALHVLVLLPVLPGVSGIDRRYWCWYLWTHSDLVSHCPSPGHAEPGLLHLSTETVWCIPLVCTIMWPSPSNNN